LRNIEEIRRDLRDVRIFCGRYFPFVVIPLSYVRIVATETIPTAGVDKEGTLAINPRFWLSLSMEEKRYVAIHETLHIVLLHPSRMRGFNREAYNFASDGKVNYAISSAKTSGISCDRGSIVTLHSLATVTGLRVQDLERMSTEEITRLLEREGSQGDWESGDLLEGEVEGVEVQAGNSAVTSTKDTKGLEGRWRSLAEKAKAFAKQAGSMPAALERMVDEVLEVKPPWRVTVRFGIRNSAKQDSSFAYPNRRSDDLPGPIGYRYAVWCLVDCSGSIGEAELKGFLGVVKHEARRAQVCVIAWDSEAYEVLKAERPADVARRVAPKMRGGGGTVNSVRRNGPLEGGILPALQRVHRLMSLGDAVIALTDGHVFDAEKGETRGWFRRVARKAGFAMVGYTCKPVEAPGFASVFIDFKSN
jgi:predicted metal-dependent peptidase